MVIRMENVTLDMLYDELKKIEQSVHRVDQKIENFMGFEKVSKKEVKRLDAISKETRKSSKTLDQLANELGVKLDG